MSVVRPVPATPAQVKAYAVLRKVPSRVIQRLDPGHGELLVIVDRRFGVDLVPILGDTRVVELEDESGVDDRLVLLAHRVGAGVHELFVGRVVLVHEPRAATGCDGVEEALLGPGSLERGPERLDVALHIVMTGIGDGPPAHRKSPGRAADADPRFGIGVGLGELQPVPSIREAAQHDVARRRPVGRHVPQIDIGQFQPAQPLEDVSPPGAVIHPVRHRVAVLAVVDDVDADVALSANHRSDRVTQVRTERTVINGLAGLALTIALDEVVGSWQTPGMAGQDPLLTIIAHAEPSPIPHHHNCRQ